MAWHSRALDETRTVYPWVLCGWTSTEFSVPEVGVPIIDALGWTLVLLSALQPGCRPSEGEQQEGTRRVKLPAQRRLSSQGLPSPGEMLVSPLVWAKHGQPAQPSAQPEGHHLHGAAEATGGTSPPGGSCRPRGAASGQLHRLPFAQPT